jgi:plasmid stabilization system protein ParE
MNYKVCFAELAEENLLRLFDCLLQRAATAEDLGHAQHVIDTLRTTLDLQLALTWRSTRSKIRQVGPGHVQCALEEVQ